MIKKTILHYKILEVLGKGGMGVVYKAEDLKLGRIVALKFLSNFPIANQEEISRFEREARSAASLNHPNICTIYEFNQTDEFAFIAMEYIEGETLKQILKRDDPLPQSRAVEIAKAIAEALSVAHKNGIIHRDIKSDNVMISKDGQVKIMDFGLAKLKDAPTITQSKSPMGTIAYMSPEQIEGKQLTHQTDLWSLGVVFFEMLTGELPFKGDSDVGLMHSILKNPAPKLLKNKNEIHQSLTFVISTLLEKDLAYRYQQAEGVVFDLKRKINTSRFKLAHRKIRKNIKKIFITFLLFCTLYFTMYHIYQTRVNIPPWIKENAKLSPLIDEKGPYDAAISPSGKHLAFRNRNNKLAVKNLTTGETNRLRENDFGTFWLPTWSNDENQIAYIGGPLNNISIVNRKNEEKEVIIEKHEGNMYHFTWSPDNKWLCYTYTDLTTDPNSYILELYNFETNEQRVLYNTKLPVFKLMAWHPDACKFAFYDYDADSIAKKITKYLRIFDIEKNKASHPIYKLTDTYTGPQLVGFSYSPDGKYLVFPEIVNDFYEFVALPLKNRGSKVSGKPVTLTNIAGTGKPYRPTFTKDGKSFSFNVGGPNEDIFIASIDIERAVLAGRLAPACVTKFFEKDACWLPDSRHIAYTLNRAGKVDIYVSNINERAKKQITFSQSFKNQLAYRFGKNSISFISNNILWQVNTADTTVTQIYPRENENLFFESAAYQCYAWTPNSDKIYGILRDNQNKSQGQLMEINLKDREVKLLVDEYFSMPYAELRLSRDGKLLAVRTERIDTTLFSIKIFNTESWELKNTIYHVSSIEFGDISWTPDSRYFTFGTWDDQPSSFFIYLYSIEDNTKQLMLERRESGRDTPGQISPDGKNMIYYKYSFESEIWLLGK